MVTEPEVRTATLMMFVGALGIVALSYATMAGDTPTLLTPYSFTVVTPFFRVGRLGSILIWPTVFLLWGLPLFAKARAIPATSAVVAGILWGLGLVWLALGARTGVVHEGALMVGGLAILNVALGGLLVWLYRKNWNAPAFASNYAFHWLVVAWSAWGAMPWLGEGL
jgi:hypothetical protein